MAYQKHVWVARTGTKLNRFLKYNETATSVELVNSPESITQEGTPFSAQIMNEIEEEMERSSQAQEQINADNAEINAKQTEIESAINANASAISAEVQRAANAESALSTAISTAESNAKNLANATGTLLNLLFNRAIATGKRVRSETRIAYNAVSVSYAAVELARSKLGDLSDCQVLLFGAGKMAELTATNLVSQGLKSLYVANRHIERAMELAEKYGGQAVEWPEVYGILGTMDIVIPSTGAPISCSL